MRLGLLVPPVRDLREGAGPTSRTGPLDGDLVWAGRLELGLSERKFTAVLGTGFSQTVVRGIEAGTTCVARPRGSRLCGRLVHFPANSLGSPICRLRVFTSDDQPPQLVR